MTSDKMNEIIYDLDSDNIGYESFGGKVIPYVGWFWRKVNFDLKYCCFGIIPGNPPVVGFMQNNKWDYDSICARGEKWIEIKELIIKALNDKTVENFKAANEAIQGLIK